MRKWSSRSLRAMQGIHPELRRLMDAVLQSSPLDFIVIEGLRTPERQQEMVSIGASKTLNSRHLTGHAVDLLPIGPNGPRFDWPLYDILGPAVKAEAARLGIPIKWGGDWQSFRDGPHFELDRAVYPPTLSDTYKQPTERVFAETRTVAGAAIAGVGGLGQEVLDAARSVEEISTATPYLHYLFIAMLVFGTALVLYARWSDWKAGHK